MFLGEYCLKMAIRLMLNGFNLKKQHGFNYLCCYISALLICYDQSSLPLLLLAIGKLVSSFSTHTNYFENASI